MLFWSIRNNGVVPISKIFAPMQVKKNRICNVEI